MEGNYGERQVYHVDVISGSYGVYDVCLYTDEWVETLKVTNEMPSSSDTFVGNWVD